ncbi:Nucleoporin SEH1 [Plecturocebus cupreus]
MFFISRKELTSSGGPTKFELHIVAQFDNHNSQVWRVSWNITGTVLASSGDDGCVRLWKANYMDNWKCTGILKGNGSPVNGSSQQGNSNPSLGSNIPSLQNSLNGSSAGRYFFPPLDSPRAGSRWSSYAQLLPPPPLPPLVEHSCDADTANLQYPHPRRRYLSRPLNPLPENERTGPLLLRLECSGMIMAHRSLELLGSSAPPTSGSHFLPRLVLNSRLNQSIIPPPPPKVLGLQA